MIIEQILVTNLAVFCYLIADEATRDAILIDPAGDYKKIFAKIESHNANIRYIMNTHGHFDHTSGNTFFRSQTDAVFLIHEDDVRFLKKVTPEEYFPFSKGKDEPVRKVLLLADNDCITIGNMQLWVIHTPGHSPGSICLYSNGNLFTGDTIFTEGYGRTDIPGGSEETLMKSIREKILTLPDETVIWPGHHYGRKPTSTVAEQKKRFGVY